MIDSRYYVDPTETSILSQCIGGNGGGILKPHIFKTYLSEFDQILMCSDGILNDLGSADYLKNDLEQMFQINFHDDATIVKLTF